MAERFCTRVTGKAFEPHYWSLPEERQGPRRPNPEMRRRGVELQNGLVTLADPRPEVVYDVLCGDRAHYWVLAEGSRDVVDCCSRCLSAVIDDIGNTVHVGQLSARRTQKENA